MDTRIRSVKIHTWANLNFEIDASRAIKGPNIDTLHRNIVFHAPDWESTVVDNFHGESVSRKVCNIKGNKSSAADNLEILDHV